MQRANLLMILAIVFTLGASACGEDEVKHYRVAKHGPAPGLALEASHASPAPAGAPAPQGGGGVRWTLPAAWTESKGGGDMRYATLRPPVPGKVDVSVIVLPGPAGGELANVNRWRGQIGLAGLGETELARERKVLETGAGPVAVYDFTNDAGEKKRVVAGLANVQGNTWFLKLSGDAGAVAAARPDFLRILESLRLEAQ